MHGGHWASRPSAAGRFGVAVMIMAGAIAGAAFPAHASAAGSISEWTVPPGDSDVSSLAIGSDGSAWFVEGFADLIGRVAPDGSITAYPQAPGATGLGLGPDGNMWFGWGGGVGEISTSGSVSLYDNSYEAKLLTLGPGDALYADTGVYCGSQGDDYVTELDSSGVVTASWCAPSASGMVAGPDGNLWLAGARQIVKIDALANKVTTYPLPSWVQFTGGITVGPDDAMWFTENGGAFTASEVGRITIAGTISQFPMPQSTFSLAGITSAGGDLWVADGGASRLDRMTTAGAVTSVTAPTCEPGPLVSDTAGQLWVGSPSLGACAGRVARYNPATQTSSVWTLPPGGTQPTAITAGSDGNLWFTESGNAALGVVTPAGEFVATQFDGDQAERPDAITAGPDGQIWWPNDHGHSVSYVDGLNSHSGGGSVSVFTDYSSMATGPGGSLWVTDPTNNRIGWFTPQQVQASNFTVTYYSLPPGTSPADVTAGPDGSMWFTGPGDNAIGRSSLTGTIQMFALPHPSSDPTAIAVGADGALWFTEQAADRIGRISTTGSISEYTLPTGAHPNAVVGAPSGVYFTEPGLNAIGRLSSTGQLTQYPVPTAHAGLGGLTLGPDGNIWFTETTANKIGRLLIGSPMPTASAVITATGRNHVLYVRSGSGWASLGGTVEGAAAVAWTAGRPLYVVTGSDARLWVRDASHGWTLLSPDPTSCASGPAATAFGVTLQAACVGFNHHLYIASGLIPVTGLPRLGAWRDLGGTLSSAPTVFTAIEPPAVRGEGYFGELSYAGLGPSGHVWWRGITQGWTDTYLPCASGASVINSRDIPPFAPDLVLACRAQGHLEYTYTTYTGQTWASLNTHSFTAIVGSPALVPLPSGPEFVAIATNGAVIIESELSRSWTSLGGTAVAVGGTAT